MYQTLQIIIIQASHDPKKYCLEVRKLMCREPKVLIQVRTVNGRQGTRVQAPTFLPRPLGVSHGLSQTTYLPVFPSFILSCIRAGWPLPPTSQAAPGLAWPQAINRKCYWANEWMNEWLQVSVQMSGWGGWFWVLCCIPRYPGGWHYVCRKPIQLEKLTKITIQPNCVCVIFVCLSSFTHRCKAPTQSPALFCKGLLLVGRKVGLLCFAKTLLWTQAEPHLDLFTTDCGNRVGKTLRNWPPQPLPGRASWTKTQCQQDTPSTS
jgi:hypothetical protein